MRTSRRNLLRSGAAALAAANVIGTMPLFDRALAQAPAPSGRTLIKGGTVVSIDRGIGDLPQGDVLIEGARIAAVGQSLAADNAQVVDAREMIVMPGFIDSHRHMWEGAIRNLIPDANLRDYLTVILGKYGPAYRPDDVYIGDLVSALSALDAGITTIVDWSPSEHAGAHRRGDPRAAGIRHARDVRLRVSGAGRQAVVGRDELASVPRRYRAAAQAILFVR